MKFKIFKEENKEFLSIDSKHPIECMEYAVKNKIRNILIRKHQGFETNTIEFLRNYADFVEGLFISSEFISDIHIINSLQNLRILRIDKFDGTKLNFSLINKLTELSMEWPIKIQGLCDLTNLEVLKIWKFRSKSDDIAELSCLSKVKELHIIQSGLNSLRGIENLQNLKTLNLAVLSKFKNLKNITLIHSSLEQLYFENCKRLSGFENLVLLKKLIQLSFVDCNSIPSLEFINQLPKLRRLNFSKTLIVDGDISPCKNLSEVFFTNEKGYNIKNYELNKSYNRK